MKLLSFSFNEILSFKCCGKRESEVRPSIDLLHLLQVQQPKLLPHLVRPGLPKMSGHEMEWIRPWLYCSSSKSASFSLPNWRWKTDSLSSTWNRIDWPSYVETLPEELSLSRTTIEELSLSYCNGMNILSSLLPNLRILRLRESFIGNGNDFNQRQEWIVDKT